MVRRIFRSFCLISIVFALSVTPIRAQQATPAVLSSNGEATLTQLAETILPATDRIDLAKRLRGVTNIPTPPTTPLKTYNVGDQEQFWADNADTEHNFQLTAELLYATPHVYMWFEVGENPDLAAVKRSADNFEKRIYPTVHQYFGSEWTPGIDGDVHLYLLHAHNLGSSVGGYFSSSNEYPSAVVKTSNQHEVFFINLDSTGAGVGTAQYDGTLAHEFQHMVHNIVDPNEEGWLNEGLAELSRLLNGYTQLGSAPVFLKTPNTQLNSWNADTSNIPHYGASYLFTAYFLGRFGVDALKMLVADPLNGLVGFDDVLAKIHAIDPITKKPITAVDLFADWQIANLLDDSKVSDGRYGYAKITQHLPTPHREGELATGTTSGDVSQWGTRYFEITAAGTYKLHFAGAPTVHIVPTDPHGGARMWWSSRSDQSDTTLTHDFDLSGVKSATLDFWLWHSIEKEWDYGYVEVSTDGGATWKPLKTADSDTNDPHDNAYGPGFTGNSGIAQFDTKGTTAIWKHEKVDLKQYTGKSIKVRFESITDDAVTLPGMLVDDISIPEIGYHTDAETDDGGWVGAGWVRVDNTLPQRYLIQSVAIGQSTSVTRLLDASDGASGDWTLTVGGDVQRIVISLSGLTPFTTEAAPYTFTLTRQK